MGAPPCWAGGGVSPLSQGRHTWVSTTLMQEMKHGAVVRSRCPLGIYRQASTAR